MEVENGGSLGAEALALDKSSGMVSDDAVASLAILEASTKTVNAR